MVLLSRRMTAAHVSDTYDHPARNAETYTHSDMALLSIALTVVHISEPRVHPKRALISAILTVAHISEATVHPNVELPSAISTVTHVES